MQHVNQSSPHSHSYSTEPSRFLVPHCDSCGLDFGYANAPRDLTGPTPPLIKSTFKKSTIHKITKNLPKNIKTATPTPKNAKDKRHLTRLKTDPARGLSKKKAAQEHRTKFTQISKDANFITIYTDGSKKYKQENRTGAGWVLYWRGVEERWGREVMGNLPKTSDAEMLALLRGLESGMEYRKGMPEGNKKQSKIVLFTDSKSSVEAIEIGKPRPSQPILREYIETAMTFLDKNKRASIEVSWVPAHKGITGNNRADGIAKGATQLEPATIVDEGATDYQLAISLRSARKQSRRPTPLPQRL